MKPNHIPSLISIFYAAVALTWTALAHADEVYKHVDEQGRVTYSNKPIKGGKKVDLPPLTTIPAPKPPKAAPAPKTDPDKDSRRSALQDEIAKTEKALQAAKATAKEEADKPETFKRTKTVKGKDGKTTQVTETGRNVVAYEEKMKKLNDNIAQLEKTLETLKAELAALDVPKTDKNKEDKN